MKRLPQKILQQGEDLIVRIKQEGVHWSQIGGQRLPHNSLIKFDLQNHYRLVCWFRDDSLTRHKVLSHQDYEPYAANTHR